MAFEPIKGHASSSFWRSLENITQQVFSSTHSLWEGTAHGVTIPACLHPFPPSSGLSLGAPALSPSSPHQCPQGTCLCFSCRPPINLGDGWGSNVPEPVMHAELRPCVGKGRGASSSSSREMRSCPAFPSMEAAHPLHMDSWKRAKGFLKGGSLDLGSGPAGLQRCLLRNII